MGKHCLKSCAVSESRIFGHEVMQERGSASGVSDDEYRIFYNLPADFFGIPEIFQPTQRG
jgi:hypothetical protein